MFICLINILEVNPDKYGATIGDMTECKYNTSIHHVRELKHGGKCNTKGQ